MEEHGHISVHDCSMSDIEIMLDGVFANEKEIPQVVVKVWNDKEREHRQYVSVKVKSSKQPIRQLYGVRFKVTEVTYFSERLTYVQMDSYMSRWLKRYLINDQLFEIRYIDYKRN